MRPLSPPRLAASKLVVPLALGLSLAGLVLLHLAGRAADRHSNADSAGFILLVRDLLGGADLSDWTPGTHLYLFPDGFLTALSLALAGLGVPLRIALVVVFGACLLAALAAVWSVTFGQRYKQALLCTAVALNIAYLLSYVVLGGWFEMEMMTHLLLPSTHQGSLVVACLAFALATRVLAVRDNRAVLCLFILIVLASLSDAIFVAWGATPLLVVALTAGRATPRGALTLTLVTVIAATIGLAVSTMAGMQSEIRMAHLARARVPLDMSIRHAMGFVIDGALFESPSQGVLFYTNAVLWFAGAFSAVRAWQGRPVPYGATLVFCGAASSAALLAATLTGVFQGVATMRYVMPYVLFGSLAPAAILVALAARASPRLVPLAVPVLAVAALAVWLTASRARYDHLAHCLRERHLVSGAAHYWDANPLLLADANLSVMPLQPEGFEPYNWNTNRKRLAVSPVEFVVTTPAGLTRYSGQFGPPARVTTCGERLIVELAHPAQRPR